MNGARQNVASIRVVFMGSPHSAALRRLDWLLGAGHTRESMDLVFG
jgi:hypothetical protein